MDNLHSVNSSPSVVERKQTDGVAVMDYLHTGDDIPVPTESRITVVPRWTGDGKGHKRSRSNTIDYCHLTKSSATKGTAVRHRRSSSCDVNLVLYKKTDQPPATEVESNSSGVKDDEQEEEQKKQLTALNQMQDEVDFSSMFGKWKGKQINNGRSHYTCSIHNYLFVLNYLCNCLCSFVAVVKPVW